MLKVKGIIGTHQWGLYRNGELISTHNSQNNAIDAKQKLCYNDTQTQDTHGTI